MIVDGIALRRALQRGYGAADLKADLAAGAVVGVVALPLSMALAIACGVPPQHGLYTAIVAGAVIALLGGSRVQVSGPTAAFVAILVPIVSRFGVGGLLLATALAGLILIALGLARFGRLIELVPEPVTLGFTSGIAVVIATLQVKDFLGLSLAEMPDHFVERVAALARALPTVRWEELAAGGFTLALLVLLPRWSKRVPAPIVALGAATLLGYLLTSLVPGFALDTIHSRFHFEVGGEMVSGIPRTPPMPLLPWNLPGPDGQPLALSFDLFRALLPAALAIAVLGAIESLLSAVVADSMTGGKHEPDAELVAQGVGNLVAPFFGGFAATGAIARTATNVRAGARSPVAAITHSLVVLLAVVLAAPLLSYLPMAALAAQLLVTAWNIGELRHVARTIATAPKSDGAVLLTCFGLTVLFDMVVAVTAGIVMASLLFMRRMADVSGVQLAGATTRRERGGLPDDVVLFEISGPLFFGAAAKLVGALDRVPMDMRAVVLDLRAAPALDATALNSLATAVGRLRRRGIRVVLAGLQEQPFRALVKAGWRNLPGELYLRRSFEKGIALARP